MNDNTDFNSTLVEAEAFTTAAKRTFSVIVDMVDLIEEKKDKGKHRCQFRPLVFEDKEPMWLFVCSDEMGKFFQQIMKDTQEKIASKS